MIFVAVYPIAHQDRKKLEPGDIFEISEAELPEWAREIESFRPRLCSSMDEAEALSASILDGSFVLSPEVSHPIMHGGFFGGGKDRAIKGDMSLDRPQDTSVGGLMRRIRRSR